MATPDERVLSVVAARRLATGTAPRRTFTIERSEARMRLRARPSNTPWSWTLALLHAAHVLSTMPGIAIACAREGELDVWSFDVAVPGADFSAIDLAALLDASVEPDPGPSGPLHVRVRRLLARALNEALAAAPAWVELVTPIGTRRCERRAAVGPRDPYDERGLPATGETDRLRFRVALPPTGLGKWMDVFRDSANEGFEIVRKLWRRALPWAPPDVQPGQWTALRQPLPGAPVVLGDFARWWPTVEQGEVALVRDGLRVAALDVALGKVGLPTALLRGFIECDALRTTIDDGAIVEDQALADLATWLRDALAHARHDEKVAITVHWPDPPELQNANGHPIDAPQLEQLAAHGREVLYAWPHELEQVPTQLRARVLALWPSALVWVRARWPALSFVPVRGLLAAKQVARTDLTALAQGSLPGLAIPVEPWRHGDAAPLPLDVVALVHRHGAAERGAVIVLAWERSLGRLGDSSAVPPGISLVVRLSDAARVDALQADAEALRALALHVAQSATAQIDALVRHAIAHGGSDAIHRIPFLRRMIESLSPRALELRYVVHAERPVELRWHESPLLDLVVAHTRAQAPITLRAALERMRDVGGIVVGDATRRWFTLEDEDPAHATWIPTPKGLELLPQLFGRAAIWEMPIVPQSMIHVAPAAAQRALLLDAQEVARLLLRASSDAHARTRLLGHLLVARAIGEPEQGLADVALLSTYDPRAVDPGRLRSVAALLAEGRRFAVVPTGTATRELVGPVVEATPGEAALLHEVLELPTVPIADGAARPSVSAASTAAPPRTVREPVLSVAIADPLAVGALHLHADPSPGTDDIEIWAKGLRVGALALPAPLAEVEGKLWLSDAGVRAKHEGISSVVAQQGRALVATAVRQVALAAPGSPRRRVLERFLDGCRTSVAQGPDRFGLRTLLIREPEPVAIGPAQAVAVRLPPLRRLWITALVRHALGHPTKIETPWLAWRPAKLADPKAAMWEIELGSRHRWIRKAMSEDASVVDVVLASMLAVADVLAQAGAPSDALATALLRVLATTWTSPRT